MTNITASLCLASGFLSLVPIPDLLLKHCYSWDTLYSRTDSYKLESTSFIPPEMLLLQGEWLEEGIVLFLISQESLIKW